MPQIADKRPALRTAAKAVKSRSAPLWQGPGGEGPQGGITQGLLGRYLCCKERFRLQVIEGLKPQDKFESRMEFGNMWHVCEESLAGEIRHFGELIGTTAQEDALRDYVEVLHRRYPMQRVDVDHWADKCRTMFPLYVEHWRTHPDVKDRTPVFQEQTFDVPYRLPSGRTVRLRGKWDSVDIVSKNKAAAFWLQENKTKSDINELRIGRQLAFDLQTMLYLVALIQDSAQAAQDRSPPVAGVRYNVVRRSAHKQGKKESAEEFCARLAQLIRDDIKEKGVNNEWFQRWNAEVSAGDIAKFRQECLDPVLENLCNDYEWWAFCKEDGCSPFNQVKHAHEFIHRLHHFRLPYGVYNPLLEGGAAELDEFLATGSMVGLRRADDLFPELK